VLLQDAFFFKLEATTLLKLTQHIAVTEKALSGALVGPATDRSGHRVDVNMTT